MYRLLSMVIPNRPSLREIRRALAARVPPPFRQADRAFAGDNARLLPVFLDTCDTTPKDHVRAGSPLVGDLRGGY